MGKMIATSMMYAVCIQTPSKWKRPYHNFAGGA